MKTLLKNGIVINVFTGECEKSDILIEGSQIAGVGDYTDTEADLIEDLEGKYVCPGFIDGHIHIESTMLSPSALAQVCVPHGTTSLVADPHEIANVCGTDGIRYMLEASEGIPLTVYIMLPSCVPSTSFDESGAVLEAEDLAPFYSHPRVLGLAEVMNYPGVIARDPKLMKKIQDARRLGLTINGHAPLLSGKALDRYIAAGIRDDHECSSAEEAMERIRKGQRVMIRQGTAARNLDALLPLFEEPWAHRCLLVTDDKHPADLLGEGHIDSIIRRAAAAGKNPVTGIRMATLWAAESFGLKDVGAVAPGYTADLLILDDLDTVSVKAVYRSGVLTAKDGKMILSAAEPALPEALDQRLHNSFSMGMLSEKDFLIDCDTPKTCRVIGLCPGELLTEEKKETIDFTKNNGIDIERDLLKIAVAERHLGTGHLCTGFIKGAGMKRGAIASSVSHDSHNLIIIGTNESDMAIAGNRIRELGGGCIVVDGGKILSEMPLPLGGVMSDLTAPEIARQNEALRESVHSLGVPQNIEPFMNMAFVSLAVIPHLKITTKGLADVDTQQLVPLICES